jgi:GNAT superfamily N-acetyltransferase
VEQIDILSVTDTAGEVIAPAWLAKSEPIHRQLRPMLPSHYEQKMRRVFAGGGRMCIATDGTEVVGLAVYRIYENTVYGRHIYVDDLVTDALKRSLGVGKSLLNYMQVLAKEQGCVKFKLDSGTHRLQAHKFYFREGLVISAFNFQKDLTLDSERDFA